MFQNEDIPPMDVLPYLLQNHLYLYQYVKNIIMNVSTRHLFFKLLEKILIINN